MIVKNESSVIERCLTSMLPVIDYWVIVDTGSTDKTQEIIKNFMKEKGVKGELHERPWVNFGHNRNEALDLARDKAEYVFFIDADEYLEYEPNFKLPELDKDSYYVTISHSGSLYQRLLLINMKYDWKWIGVLHEYIGSTQAKTVGTLENVKDIYTTEGARSKDPEKYLKDAAILEKGLIDEPHNERYVFYLAQSYGDAGQYEKSLEWYEKRIAIGGWDQEVYWSMFKSAQMKENLQRPYEEVIEAYNRAFQFRKSRFEPLYHIAYLAREKKKDFYAGYMAAKVACSLPKTEDLLFVQQWMKDYGIELELSICAYWLGKYEECKEVSENLLKRDLPQSVKECVTRNLEFANGKIIEQICSPSRLPSEAL